ncbi:MAG: glucose 1-dehydrogenase [SAR202 cluster bacterium]|nr:glucose 1-dehydrogenase [SAR202 cluster bacterium]
MVLRLENKVAIITGGTSGMGKATANLFAKEGAKVVICGRRLDLGQEIVQGIKNGNGDAIFIAADVSNESDVKELVHHSISKYSKVDVLFNNAGINEKQMSKITDETKSSWDKIFDVNLNGMFLMIKHVLPEMVKAGRGSIINNSSVLSLQANKVPSTSYHASKGAVTSMTRKIAIDYAQSNIRINAIHPGSIATEMTGVEWKNLKQSEVIGDFKKKQPLPRMGHPIDIAYAALYLASDESAFVTGTTLTVDGGQSSFYRVE